MSGSKSYKITLKASIVEHIEEVAKRVYVEPEQLILFLLLAPLRDLQSGKVHLPYYRKILEKLKRELEYEKLAQKNEIG